MNAAEGTGGQAVGTVDDAEPLNDAEAEAVLLRLAGTQLEWTIIDYSKAHAV